MEIIKVLQGDVAGREVAIQKALHVLKKGGVVMHETETCYGLAADINSEKALDKVYAIKKMKKSKPVSIMVGSVSEAKKYGRFTQVALNLVKEHWPGPLTLLLPRTDKVPYHLNEEFEFVGIRCPGSEMSCEMVSLFGSPLTTTSANISGKKEVYDVTSFLNQVQETDLMPDLIIDSGKLEGNLPSTIVRIDGNEVHFLRKGELSDQVRSIVE